MLNNSDYTDLVTAAHSSQPNFMAFLNAMLAGATALQAALVGLPATFDLDAAVGVQLDAVGLWINRSRNIQTPIANVYFSFDIAGVGYDQGIIFGPFSPTVGITQLDDEHYRTLLRAKIGSNMWDGSAAAAAAILGTFFAGEANQPYLFIQDNFDMTAWLGMSGPLPSTLSQLLVTGGYITLRSMGVLMRTAITTVDGAPIFGFDVENQYVSGLDVGSVATTTP